MHSAVDLFRSLQTLLQDWPQLLKDFAAFLLPEQALSCGLFEEQQAFEKSRKFLRQLEICFAENPSHHQKIIKVLQGCADCLPQDITEVLPVLLPVSLFFPVRFIYVCECFMCTCLCITCMPGACRS